MNEPRKRGRPRKNPVVVSNELAEEALLIDRPLKVHISPFFRGEDKGDGGVRRVVEAQNRHFPKFGIEITSAEEADVLVAHIEAPHTWDKLYPLKTRVAICHGLMWSEYNWPYNVTPINAKVIENIRTSDAVITCSEWVANSIRRHTSRYVDVIPHGIENEEWSHGENKGYVLWNKTRPDPVCDPEPMNQVAALLPEVPFVTTFGNDAPNVIKTGKLPFERSKELIRNAAVYLATTRETFGIGTIEAMACGVPVVGFNFAGQAEFIEHGIDGWLATPGDIDGLAEGIKWALANRGQVGAAAKLKADQFSWEKACAEYAAVLKRSYLKKNTQGPRTTILVTNYNLHDYLPACLRSVVNQTDQDWECIVVDDASPDKTGIDSVNSFIERDNRFKLIVNEKNVYLAEARNIGIRAAKGRYILPLDADDMLAPDTVALLADALDSDRSIHVAYGNVLFVEEDGTPIIYGPGFTPGHSSWPYPFSHEQQIMQRNLLPYCSMFRKEAWEQTGGYRRRCRTAEDADLWTRLSSYGFRPKMVSEADTLIYRNREGSMSRTNSTEWIRWFSWTKIPEITPAGAATKEQLPIPSLDPIIISVIIPVGPGHEKIVTDAVDSVDTQSFRNWECIVVNDTGHELTTELPSWVKVIDTEGNKGPAFARNRGIEASHGRLFLPLDADDYLEPDALKFMFMAYQDTKDVIYSDFWQTDMNGENINVHECDDYDPQLITGRKRTVKGQVREGMMHSVTALTPKAVWKQIGGYDESMPAWEDWDFQIAIGNIGVCSYRVPLPLFVYRKHTGYRREQNQEFFARSKEGIIRKWGSLWEGGQELMACRSCGATARRSFTPPPSVMAQPAGASGKPGQDEAVLVEYIGEKQGATSYRGPSRTVYWFAAGDKKFVRSQDVSMFLAYPNSFRIIPRDNGQVSPAVMGSPLLVAKGQA